MTFEINGSNEDEIRAAGLDLRHNFDRAAARRVPGYRKGLLMAAMDGKPDEAPPENTTTDPERLFDE